MSSKSIRISPSTTAFTSIMVLHVEPHHHAALRSDVLAFAGRVTTEHPMGVAVLDGRDRRRIAVYLQWRSPEQAEAFLASPLRDDLERRTAAHASGGEFHLYAVPYVHNSRQGSVTDLSEDYRGVTAVNEVRTRAPHDQPDLTRIMIRTDSVTRWLPFHHAANIHTSTDGTTNLNVLQFRFGIVRVVVWFILRFGRTTEALRHGTPDVHFYRVVLARGPAAAEQIITP